ncbi:MAG: hypothetical protein WDA24_09700 [Tissierellales bacterium]
MKIRIVKIIGFFFILLSLVIVSYFAYQNYNSVNKEPKRATLVLNLE